jgi:hypothetical protein
MTARPGQDKQHRTLTYPIAKDAREEPSSHLPYSSSHPALPSVGTASSSSSSWVLACCGAPWSYARVAICRQPAANANASQPADVDDIVPNSFAVDQRQQPAFASVECRCLLALPQLPVELTAFQPRSLPRRGRPGPIRRLPFPPHRRLRRPIHSAASLDLSQHRPLSTRIPPATAHGTHSTNSHPSAILVQDCDCLCEHRIFCRLSLSPALAHIRRSILFLLVLGHGPGSRSSPALAFRRAALAPSPHRTRSRLRIPRSERRALLQA